MNELNSLLSKLSSKRKKELLGRMIKRELFKSIDDSVIVLNTIEMEKLKKEKELYISAREPLVLYENDVMVPLNKCNNPKDVKKLFILDNYLKGYLIRRLEESSLSEWTVKVVSEVYCDIDNIFKLIDTLFTSCNIDSDNVKVLFESSAKVAVRLSKDSKIVIKSEDFPNLKEDKKMDILCGLYSICDVCDVYINDIDIRGFIENDVKVNIDFINYLMPRLFTFNKEENMLGPNIVAPYMKQAYRKILKEPMLIQTLLKLNEYYDVGELYIFVKQGKKIKLEKAFEYGCNPDLFRLRDLETIGG